MFSKFKTLKKNDTKLDFPVCFFPLDNDFFFNLVYENHISEVNRQ